MSNEICILGAGGHAKVVIEIAELQDCKIQSVFDQNVEIGNVLQYTVNHDLSKCSNVFLGLGSNQSRKENAEKFSTNPINLIHPNAIVSRTATLGLGNVVMAGVVINSSTIIGNHCIVNTKASIDHDCSIGDYAHVSPGATLAGNVKVGEGAQIGIGACVKQNIKIGKWSIVGAGAVVIKDVPDYTMVVGNPARELKRQ